MKSVLGARLLPSPDNREFAEVFDPDADDDPPARPEMLQLFDIAATGPGRVGTQVEETASGAVTVVDAHRLGADMVMYPHMAEQLRQRYGLSPEQWDVIVASPVFKAAGRVTESHLALDPMLPTRMLAQQTLPQVIAQLGLDALNKNHDPRDRVLAAKMLKDLAEPHHVQQYKPSQHDSGPGGVRFGNITLNLGSAVAGHIQRSLETVERVEVPVKNDR